MMNVYVLCVLLGILLRHCSEAFPLLFCLRPFSLHQDGETLSSSSSSPSSSSSTAFRLSLSSSTSDQSLCNNNNSNSNSNNTSSVTHEQQQQQQSALTLQQQAAALRAQADAMRQEIQDSQTQKLLREQQAVDQWIQQLLFSPASSAAASSTTTTTTTTTTTEMLNTVDQVVRQLQEGRFSHEQIRKIFRRICETETAPQSRSRCSELMRLLLDATCRMDSLEREKNPNKRWSGWVERDLQKRLFAKDWGIELEDTMDSSRGDASF